MTREAFERQLTPLADAAYRYAHRLTGHKDDAMDLLQEATLDAFKGREGYAMGTNFKAWFFKVLTNRFYRTQQRKRVEAVPLDDAPDAFLYEQAKRTGAETSGDDPAAALFGTMESEAVRGAIDALPDEFRDACSLYFVGDMSYEEIAQTLDVPVGTVRSRLHRGRKLLQVQLWDLAKERGLVAGELNA